MFAMANIPALLSQARSDERRGVGGSSVRTAMERLKDQTGFLENYAWRTLITTPNSRTLE
jgi:hypothetical protein